MRHHKSNDSTLILPNVSSRQVRVVSPRWRKQHEQLTVMTGSMKGLVSVAKDVGEMDMEEEVKEVYEEVKRIDVLDVSICVSLSCTNR